MLYYFMLPGIWLPAPIPTSNLPLPTSHFVDAPGTVPFASVSPSLRLGHLGGASSGVSLQQLRQRKKDPYKGIKYIQLTPNVHNIDTQIFYYRLGHITNRWRCFGNSVSYSTTLCSAFITGCTVKTVAGQNPSEAQVY